jgi:replicative DNA helicase
LHEEQQPIDLMTVLTWLKDRQLLERIGGQSKLSELRYNTVSAVNIDQHAALINRKYFDRRLIAIGHEITIAGNDSTLSQSAKLELLQAKVFALASQQVEQRAEHIADTLQSVYAEIERNQQTQQPIGLQSGFYDLDKITGGFQRADLIILAARPSMGKTAILLNIMRNVAAGEQKPVLFFSLETSKEQIAYRLLASEVRTASGILRAGKFAEAQWTPICGAVSQLSGLPIYIYDKPKPSIAEIQAVTRMVQAQAGEIGMVTLDYLQRMDMGENETHGLGKISGGLKDLALDLKCPVLALSQLNRSVEARQDKRPMMSDLRQSGCLEQDADLILMLYRDQYYHPDTVDKDIAEVNISKHRNGAAGMIKLLFEPEFTQFRNLAVRRRVDDT